MARLADLLLLVPSYVGIAPEMEALELSLVRAGARIVRSDGVPDPSWHRCLTAKAAFEAVRAQTDIKHVLWLDADMSGPTSAVLAMLNILESLIERFGLVKCPALSGLYVMRTRSTHFAAERRTYTDPLVIDGFELVPAWTGMGCLLQTAEAFMAHVAESHAIGDLCVPGVCESGFRFDRERWTWRSEDWDYCEREWIAGRGVYLAPVRFGHVVREVRYPTDETLLLCEAESNHEPRERETNPGG